MIFLFFLIFICLLDRVAFSILGVRIKSAFHLNNAQFGLVVSAFAVAYTLFEIPSGILGDRVGQRSLFIRIVIWWSLFTALTGLTTGLISLIIVRFLFGVGEAGAWPNGVATVSRWMPTKETSRGFSFITIGSSLGNVAGPFILVPIAVSFGWRAPFFLIALFGLVWVIFCVTWFKNNPSEMKNITNEERIYIESNRRIQTHKRGFSWRTAFKGRNLWLLPLAYFCCNFGWAFYVYWMPNYVQEQLHFSENEMMYISSLVYLAGAIGGFVMGILSDTLVKKRGLKFGRRLIGVTSLSIAALLFFTMGLSSNVTIGVCCLFLALFFIVSNAVPSFSTCIDIGGNSVGAVTGIMNTGGQIATVSIGIVVGILSNIKRNYAPALFVIGFVLISGAFLWLLIDPTKKLAIDESKLVQHLEMAATV